MKKDEKDLKYKIGYCKNKFLKGVNGDKEKGHYVIIRKINNDGTCDVNTFTSLEFYDRAFKNDRLSQVRKGNTYSIPYYDSNFPLWTGVSTNIIKNVEIKNITDIGKKHINRKHLFFIGKFCNKKR